MGSESADVRIARIEQDAIELKSEFKELKTDIRSLTVSVSKLAETVAVLGERVAHISLKMTAPLVTVGAAPASPVVAGATLGGAVGGGLVVKLLAWLGVG